MTTSIKYKVTFNVNPDDILLSLIMNGMFTFHFWLSRIIVQPFKCQRIGIYKYLMMTIRVIISIIKNQESKSILLFNTYNTTSYIQHIELTTPSIFRKRIIPIFKSIVHSISTSRTPLQFSCIDVSSIGKYSCKVKTRISCSDYNSLITYTLFFTMDFHSAELIFCFSN